MPVLAYAYTWLGSERSDVREAATRVLEAAVSATLPAASLPLCPRCSAGVKHRHDDTPVDGFVVALKDAATRLPPTAAGTDDEIRRDLLEAVAGLQMHRHNKTRCRKGGHAGTDEDCSVHQHLERIEATEYFPALHTLVLKSHGGMLVSYNSATTFCFRCNTAVYLVGSRNRQLHSAGDLEKLRAERRRCQLGCRTLARSGRR